MTHAKTLQFEVENLDDILTVVRRLRQRGDFERDTATAPGPGLKLFGEVMLKDKDNPLLSSLQSQFGAFLRIRKKGPDAS